MEIEIEEDTESWISGVMKQLSGIMIIIIITGGIVICLLLFIFAKRQIVRFAIRSHRGAAPGTNASTAMRREIYRRMEVIKKITYEPKLLSENLENMNPDELPCHYYRMKAMDDGKTLEDLILRKRLGNKRQKSYESLRSYLIATLCTQVDQKIMHQYCDLYEGARFNPQPFTEKEYKEFIALLQQLQTAITKLEPRRSLRGGGISATSVTPGRDPANNRSFNDSSQLLLRRPKWPEKSSTTQAADGQKDTIELSEATRHILDSSGYQEHKSTNV